MERETGCNVIAQRQCMSTKSVIFAIDTVGSDCYHVSDNIMEKDLYSHFFVEQ